MCDPVYSCHTHSRLSLSHTRSHHTHTHSLSLSSLSPPASDNDSPHDAGASTKDGDESSPGKSATDLRDLNNGLDSPPFVEMLEDSSHAFEAPHSAGLSHAAGAAVTRELSPVPMVEMEDSQMPHAGHGLQDNAHVDMMEESRLTAPRVGDSRSTSGAPLVLWMVHVNRSARRPYIEPVAMMAPHSVCAILHSGCCCMPSARSPKSHPTNLREQLLCYCLMRCVHSLVHRILQV